jgi:hypothetical protein
MRVKSLKYGSAQEVWTHRGRLLTMFHRLILRTIGYRGPVTDFSGSELNLSILTGNIMDPLAIPLLQIKSALSFGFSPNTQPNTKKAENDNVLYHSLS